MKRLGRQTTPGDVQTETSLVRAHDYAPRRLTLSQQQRLELPPLSIMVVDGAVDLLLVPNFGPVYAARLPVDVAAVLLPTLEGAARALVPIVGADGDLGPLQRLAGC